MSNWYMSSKNENEVVISTRIRLARNLSGIPFPARMTAEQRQQLNLRVKQAVDKCNTPVTSQLKYIEMDTVPDHEIKAMVERHIISPEFAADIKDRAILLNNDETICVMIGEEDHLRIQVIMGGMELESAYNTACELERLLDVDLNFAFDERLGYITSCPTNLGTGLRASVMLHLPILESYKEVASLSDYIRKIGFTVRGIYGEGSKAKASMYQISNQITLGIDEKTALDNLKVIAMQIVEKERERRRDFDKIRLEDIVWRAYATLKHQRILSSEEMLTLVSRIKLGQSMGILDIDADLPLQILIQGQPFMLMRRFGTMTPDERDIKRAETVRKMLE